MRTDAAGVQHPTLSDPVTPESNAHITGCAECQAVLPPDTVEYARYMDTLRQHAARN